MRSSRQAAIGRIDVDGATRLWEKRNDFRDKAGLLGSTFRVVSKADLAKDGRLETGVLTRLAGHYEDAKRVAAFVHAWDHGLEQARGNFLRALRRLDLSDLAQNSSAFARLRWTDAWRIPTRTSLIVFYSTRSKARRARSLRLRILTRSSLRNIQPRISLDHPIFKIWCTG